MLETASDIRGTTTAVRVAQMDGMIPGGITPTGRWLLPNEDKITSRSAGTIS
jgi:hypothetical protein